MFNNVWDGGRRSCGISRDVKTSCFMTRQLETQILDAQVTHEGLWRCCVEDVEALLCTKRLSRNNLLAFIEKRALDCEKSEIIKSFNMTRTTWVRQESNDRSRNQNIEVLDRFFRPLQAKGTSSSKRFRMKCWSFCRQLQRRVIVPAKEEKFGLWVQSVMKTDATINLFKCHLQCFNETHREPPQHNR